MKPTFALLSLLMLFGMRQAGSAFAHGDAFRAPRLWEAADADSIYRGPGRVYPAGNDGLWLTGLDSDWINGEPAGWPIRVRLADGTWDNSFKPGTVGRYAVWGFVEEPDGRVVMSVEGPRAWTILRLLPDGRPDPAWRVFKTLAFPRTLNRDNHGRIIAALSPGNSFTDPDPVAFAPAATTVVRLLTEGEPDPAFTPPSITGGLFTTLWSRPVVDGEGRILIAGQFGRVNDTPAINVARLLPNGALDAGFQPDMEWSGNGSIVRDMALQPDGKIVLAGRFRIPGHTTQATELLLLRLLPDGPMDADFGRVTRMQAATSDFARGLSLTPEGGLVINAGGLRKFTPAGALDGAFLTSNPGFSLNLAGLPDGRFVLPAIRDLPGLPAYEGDGAAIGLLAHLTFGSTRVPSGFAVLGGGEVLVAGQFTRAEAAVQHALVKLTATTGALATEQPDLTSWHEARRAAADSSLPQAAIRMPDGGAAYLSSLISATSNPAQPDPPYTVLGRLRPDGRPDPAWMVADSRTDRWLLNSHGPTPDAAGGILLTRVSPQSVAEGDALVVRVQPNGRRDVTFTIPPALTDGLAVVEREAVTGEIERIQLGSMLLRTGRDGRFLGIRVDHAGRQGVLKVDANLLPTPDFETPSLRELPSITSYPELWDPQSGSFLQIELTSFDRSDLRAAVELPDGRVLVGGTFTHLDGLPNTDVIARLGTNGTVDAGFRPPTFGTTPDRLERASVLALAVDGQQRIYVAGSFDLLDGQPARGLARLLPDGSVDSEFESPIESVPYPFETEATLFLEGDTLWVGGTFRALDETFPRPVWKLSTVTGPHLQAPALAGGVFTGQARLATGRSYRFQRTQNFATWTDLATFTGNGSTVTLQDSAVPSTHAGYRLVSP